jgi:hypothetical protein
MWLLKVKAIIFIYNRYCAFTTCQALLSAAHNSTREVLLLFPFYRRVDLQTLDPQGSVEGAVCLNHLGGGNGVGRAGCSSSDRKKLWNSIFQRPGG